MKVIRYSKGFKMQCVAEIESGKTNACGIQSKYKIQSTGSVMRWLREYGSGKYSKIIRVETTNEVNEAAQLRKELRRVKESLADAHMELALESAFLVAACEELNQRLEDFKKNTLAGGAPNDSRQPGVEGDLAVRTGRDDATELLCSSQRLAEA